MGVFREIFQILKKYRELTLELTRREISEKYTGQIFGVFWTFGHPLILMAIYVFVFSYVFQMKIGGTKELPLNYTVYLLSGLIPWMTSQEILNKSCSVLIQNSNMVKQIVFPIEILPVKGVLASFVTQIISSLLLIGYVAFSQRIVQFSLVLLPVLFIFQFLAMVGAAFVLSIVGAYFRDMKDLIQVFTVAGMYLMPIFYLPGWVPALFKPILYLNPFSYMIWCFQDVFYFGRMEHPIAWVVFPSLALGSFYFGYRLFRKLKHYLGSYL